MTGRVEEPVAIILDSTCVETIEQFVYLGNIVRADENVVRSGVGFGWLPCMTLGLPGVLSFTEGRTGY